MNADKTYAAEGISCFEDVPEHHDPVEPYFGPELHAGDLLDGRFAIVKTVSRSGMATIYQARDREQENQIVAVKLPHLRLEANPGFFSRFQREEEIGRKLRKFLGKPPGDVATVERIYQFTDDEIVRRASNHGRRQTPATAFLSRRSEAKTDDVRQKTEVAQDLKLLADLDSLAPWGVYPIAGRPESINLAA
jgi:hypothetical protein